MAKSAIPSECYTNIRYCGRVMNTMRARKKANTTRHRAQRSATCMAGILHREERFRLPARAGRPHTSGQRSSGEQNHLLPDRRGKSVENSVRQYIMRNNCQLPCQQHPIPVESSVPATEHPSPLKLPLAGDWPSARPRTEHKSIRG